MATVGPSLLHDIALAAEHRLALEAAKVFHVPVPPLSFCAFVCEDDLEMGKPKEQWLRPSQENALSRRRAAGAPNRKVFPTNYSIKKSMYSYSVSLSVSTLGFA